MGRQSISLITENVQRFNPILEALRSVGLDAVDLPSNEDSFRLLEESSPDVVIIDGINDTDLVHNLCQSISMGEARSDASVILLSDAVDKEDEFFAAGVRDVLPTKVDDRRLIARINLQLSLKARIDELRRLGAFFHVSQQVDSLTKLYLFPVLETRIETEMEKATPENPFTLCLFHLDQFGAVNATQGHMWGDVLVMELAGLLRESLPPGALACRFSANRLAVALPSTSKVEASQWADTFRQKVRDYPIIGGLDFISVSVGVVTYPIEQSGHSDELLHLLVGRANRAALDGGDMIVSS